MLMWKEYCLEHGKGSGLLDNQQRASRRTYLKIKTNFGYENYLSIIKNFEQRRRLSKLRISAHK
jgi:hypothetical protein